MRSVSPNSLLTTFFYRTAKVKKNSSLITHFSSLKMFLMSKQKLTAHNSSLTAQSIENLDSHEEGAGLCGAIEISRVAELASVEVFLETVEDILHAGVHLQFYVVAKHECVA